jgi:hypothetical protein
MLRTLLMDTRGSGLLGLRRAKGVSRAVVQVVGKGQSDSVKVDIVGRHLEVWARAVA